jgi:hypothetical protein
MEGLKRLPQDGFQECFQHIYICWQMCIVTQWYYSEENECTVVYLSEIR